MNSLFKNLLNFIILVSKITRNEIGTLSQQTEQTKKFIN